MIGHKCKLQGKVYVLRIAQEWEYDGTLNSPCELCSAKNSTELCTNLKSTCMYVPKSYWKEHIEICNKQVDLEPNTTHSGWINIYPRGVVGLKIYPSKDIAESWAGSDVVDTIEIQWKATE